MTTAYIFAIGFLCAGIVAVVFSLTVWLSQEIAYQVGKRRKRRRDAEDEHAAEVRAYQPPFRQPLIRWVNGRPTTPPRLPAIACSPWLWPADRRRLMAWSGVWVQPVLEFRGAGPVVADVYEVAGR